MEVISHPHVDDECKSEMGFEKYGHCHNDSKNSLDVDLLERHDIPRHEIKRIICSLCNTEQDVQQVCISCGICLGKYYCPKCKFFDDDYLFETTRGIAVLPCGHTIHLDCVKEMERHFQYACPICSKSYCDMTRVWERLDQEVALTPMPQMYQNRMVWILCNDCGKTSEVNYHIVAHKCMNCNSYNTRQTREAHTTCLPGMSEMVR
ncbi:zinc finger protein [Striga asiatica]|uniref:Zinc finger protein n=1 Tax=Striga asiatica TaxID=4170 RepID=A0A5A7PVH6_STRAF|nr:zinc finger protein [Striga asiatica]